MAKIKKKMLTYIIDNYGFLHNAQIQFGPIRRRSARQEGLKTKYSSAISMINRTERRLCTFEVLFPTVHAGDK